MIDIKQLKATLNCVIRGLYGSSYKYYGVEVSEGYSKPSFFTQLMPSAINRESFNVQNNIYTFTITYFQKAPDEADLLEKMQDFKNAFIGKVKVGDRYITTYDFEMSYTGENNNIPQYSFTLEYKDQIEHFDNNPDITGIEITTNFKK